MAAAVAVIASVACGGNPADPHTPADASGLVPAVTYVVSEDDFPNPERGLLQTVNLFEDGDVGYVQGLGVTLANARILLEDFRDAPIADVFLSDLSDGLAEVRAAGLTLIVRFQYNRGSGTDAPLARVLEHIEQLGPILRDNADVISVVQAGFIGAWGEWHSSSNDLDNPQDQSTVLLALLDELPSTHMVQVRTPNHKDEILPGGPLDEARAFSGEAIARVGHHNDCFLSSESDQGTYEDPVDEWKAYVAADGRYTPVGGESCDINTPRSDCTTALRELSELHWSFANRSYYPEVIERWKQQGCFEEIRRKLGYRFVLKWARWSEAPVAGESFDLEFCVENVGYAVPFKQRPVYAVLGSGPDRVEIELPGVDPRRWRSGETTVITTRVTLPAELAAGPHRLALWLPSAAQSVRDRAEYTVRFASEEVWDAAEAVNVLADGITVTVP